MKKISLTVIVAAAALFCACDNCKKHTDLTKGFPSASLKSEADTLSYLMGMANSPSEAELYHYLSSPQVNSDSAYAADFMRGLREGMKAADDKKQAAYLAGLQVGMKLASEVEYTADYLFDGDSTQHFSTRNVLAGMAHGLSGKKTALKIGNELIDKMQAGKELNKRMRELSSRQMERQYAEQKKAAEDFIAAKAKEDGVRPLPGGVYYKEIAAGSGPAATDGQRVKLSYEGRLANGTMFDATSQHNNPEGDFDIMTVGEYVPGFNTVLKAMPAGSEWEVYLPYDQAYGPEGNGMIPPYSVLVFKVKVIGNAE